MIHTLLSFLYWNPERVVFTVPIIDRPVVWYGLWFVAGYALAYLLLIPIFRDLVDQSKKGANTNNRDLTLFLLDRLTWFIIIGTILGARFGHVFFYEWPYYQNHPAEILEVWKGGLASHGGTIGGLLAIWLFQRSIYKEFPKFTFLTTLDSILVPTALACCFIRIGNFFNQEILGLPSILPWAVIFGDPADGSVPQPRHPVQLYEALGYFAIFVLLLCLWKYKRQILRPGAISGIFFILTFGIRFFLEFLKTHQSIMIDETFLQTGQYLSIPFILLGVALWCYSRRFPAKS